MAYYRDDPQAQTMIANMPEKTGRSLDDWITLLQASGLEKHGQLMTLLKKEHGVSHGFANSITLIYRQERDGPPPQPVDLVDQQYEKKEHLRPIYAALLAAAQALGDDVSIAPKKKNVSLRRSKQFALIQPTTRARIDLGIQLKGEPPSGRLEDGKMWGGMCSHRIQLTSPENVDDEVRSWLSRAYDAAG